MRYDEVSRLFESFQCEIRRNEKAMTMSSQRRHREKKPSNRCRIHHGSKTGNPDAAARLEKSTSARRPHQLEEPLGCPGDTQKLNQQILQPVPQFMAFTDENHFFHHGISAVLLDFTMFQ